MTSAPLPEILSADWLTEALRLAGALSAGRVRGLEATWSATKIRSCTFGLRLTYEGEADGAPTSLFLKSARAGPDGRPFGTNRREVAFYRDIAPTLPARLAPRCYGAVNATETDPWLLLLEDLDTSHAIAIEHPLPPATVACRSIVRRWARLHASLWGAPRLDSLSGRPVAEIWLGFLEKAPDRYRTFVDRFGDLLSVERRHTYERLLGSGPVLVERFQPGQPLALIHGDAHWWNCLVPKNGDPQDVRLIDWEDWAVGVGAADVAYMIAMLWFPERRRTLERPLLDDYHGALI